MDEFQFESGQVLKDVQVEYMGLGSPKYDDDGNICNMIVFIHNFNGNYSSVHLGDGLMKEGAVFDRNEYFIVSATSLGTPESCSPSSTGLKYNFPVYTVKDRVDFLRQFLKEKFNVNKVFGVIGRGLGAYDVYTWACDYPDEMEFIIVGNSSYKTNGYRYVVSKIIDNIIATSDDFYSDIYNESLSRVMVSINSLFYSNYFSKGIFQKMSNDEIDVLMEDFIDEGLFYDIYDVKARNDSIMGYNVENKLKNIKAKTVVVSVTDDLYYSPQYDTVPVKNFIDDVEIVLINSNQDFGDIEDMSVIVDVLKKTLDDLKK